MDGQTSVISFILIAGIIISMVGASYIWAVPMIDKRITITDYNLVEGFMLELNGKIVDIANTGSGEARILIPKGTVNIKGYDFTGAGNNTITIDFEVNQPIMAEGSVPVKTTSLDEIAEYGKTEPRIIMLSRIPTIGGKVTYLNMTMRYRELRSSTPRGYIIALCPGSCAGETSGSKEIIVSYDRTEIDQRDFLEGGDLTITYININVA